MDTKAPVTVAPASAGGGPAASAAAEPMHFEDVTAARDAVRRLKREGKLPAGGLDVTIAPGRYELDAPLELTGEDAGTPDAPVTWRGAGGGQTVLSAGRLLNAFEPVGDEAALARLPGPSRHHVVQCDLRRAGIDDLGHPTRTGKRAELFIDDVPAPLAGWPDEGFATVKDVLWIEPFDVRGNAGDRVGKIVYDGCRPERWVDEPDPWAHGYWFWDWRDVYQPIERIDTERHVIELARPYPSTGYRPRQRYRAVNLLCELDTPGEWYIDRDTGKLYLWPPRPVDDCRVVLSLRDGVVRMSGTSHVRLCGLALGGSRDTAVTVCDCEDVRIDGCDLRDIGGDAVRVEGGRGCTVRGCHIRYPGRGGVSLSGGDRETLTPGEHVVADNHIHDFSRVDRTYTPAVKVDGVGNAVRDNCIHDAPHNGIQLWGNDHVIEGNELHHLCLETGDVGAFYACPRDWTHRGTVIRGNFIHHISGPGRIGAMGVYLDDMTSGFTIVGNVFYKAERAAFIGGGRDNRIEGNLFVDCDRAIHVDARATNWARFHVEPVGPAPAGGKLLPDKLRATPIDSPPWRRRWPELLDLLGDEPARPKGNVVRRNVIIGENWDDISDDARPLVELSDNEIETGWRAVQVSRFDDPSELDDWQVVRGEARIDDRGLHNPAPTVLLSKRQWPLPLRLAYEATSDAPCDFSAFIGEGVSAGLLLQYGGMGNTLSRVVRAGRELVRAVITITPGRWQAVCWRVCPGDVTLTVDGEQRLVVSTTASPLDAAPSCVGLFLHNPAHLRAVTVEQYQPRLRAAGRFGVDGDDEDFWGKLRRAVAARGA
ncbi:MAG: right-handed parallel beta-helix repeat-containing protein [Planctomycetota bacterium]